MLYKLLSSYITLTLLFLLLAVGAAIATFIENDFGTASARALVYDHLWYEALLGVLALNLLAVIHRTKLYRFKARFLFHIAFVVILLGAGLTRYLGNEGIMHIREGESASSFLTTKPYLQVTLHEGTSPRTHFFPLEITAWKNRFHKSLPTQSTPLKIALVDSFIHKEGLSVSGYFDLELLHKEKRIKKRFTHNLASSLQKETLWLDDLQVDLAYGPQEIPLPFSLSLKAFELKRYPGSRSPSEYTSHVTLVDPSQKVTLEESIFMNNTLSYGGYKFFQTSYDTDEKGTILTLNQDPGKEVTYLGYALLFLGLLWNLLDPTSRFRVLLGRIKKDSLALLLPLCLLSPLASSLHAQSDYLQSYLKEHQEGSQELSKGFGELIVQAKMGRMEPLNTLNREILYKLSGESSFLGMSADQVVLGMLSNPRAWQGVPLIRVKTKPLQELIGIHPQNRARFNDFFDESSAYKLQKEVERASALPPSRRGSYENDLLKVDERLNIALMVFQGSLFKLFPLPDDPHHRWLNLKESVFMLEGEEAKTLHQATTLLLDSAFERQYFKGIEALQTISFYQYKKGNEVIPSESKLQAELLFNRLDIFPRLTPAYLVLGFLVLLSAFGSLFFPPLASHRVRVSFHLLGWILFALHTLGLLLRAYVSGHAPLSDTYESMLYISWSGMLLALLFFRRSLFALSASILMAGIFLFGAHLSHIDPEITNLVPVLKSFWLTLHVSIITASYGFFGVGAFLGCFALALFILKDRLKTPLDKPIHRLTQINEVSLILGLTLLVIGNFLGGIWANESWGRYWAWDPKETWSYISILLYALILHLRLLRPKHYDYLFSLLSLWGFGSILMTYFGVNFYLAGLHSYAQGDPLPIPLWVYVLSLALALLSLIAYPHRHLQNSDKGNS